MSDINENVKKRGRPKKQPAKEPFSETQTELMMSQGGNISMQDVKYNLNELYKKVLKSNSSIMGFDLQQYNPFLQNQRLKSLNILPGTMSREDLTKAQSDPGNNETKLRSQAWAVSSSQYLYYKILRMSCDVPLYKYYVTPELLKNSEYKKDQFIDEDIFLDDWLRCFDIQNTLKRVSLEVKREGKQTYVLRNSIGTSSDGKKTVNFATWQKMPSSHIKLVKIGSHGFIAAFNFMIFLNPAFSPEQYPDFIQDIWRDLWEKNFITSNNSEDKGYVHYSLNKKNKNEKDDYYLDINKLKNYSYTYQSKDMSFTEELSGTLEMRSGKYGMDYMFWVQLPQDLCYTFCSDTSNPWQVPDTTGLLLQLEELTDYDTLQGLIESTPLTALLTAEAEMVQQPQPGQDQTALNPETIIGLQEKFNGETSTNLEALFAPLKNFKLLSLPSQPNGSEISANATKNFVIRSGLGGIISTDTKPNVTQVKAAELLAESEAEFVTLQFENVLNSIINKMLGLKYKWRLHIWGGVFTFADECKRDKEMWYQGATFLIPKIASAYNMSVREMRSAESYIESLKIYDDLKTVTQNQQNKENESTGKTGAGRPEMSEDDVENDSSAASKASGLDKAETRNYEDDFDGKCLICGADSDDFLCEECKDRFVTDGEVKKIIYVKEENNG